MPSFPTNEPGTGKILGRAGEWLAAETKKAVGVWKLRPTDQAQIAEAVEDVRVSHLAPVPGVANRTGTKVIELPAGEIRITDVFGLLGKETMTYNVMGLRFVGAGKFLTRIVYDPDDPTTGALLKNDFWLHLQFEGLTFVSAKAGATFMQSYTTNYAQAYTFINVSWSGPWKYVFDLQGNNNNSEYQFVACENTGTQADGAFLYIGKTNTSDQFLNYWFHGFKHQSTSAPLIDAAKGGHFHLHGVDVSDWGAALTAPGYVIYLRGSAHNAGVQTLTATGLRVEAKNTQAALLYSEWGQGNVAIQCDWSSQTFAFTYGDIIYINTANEDGAIYNFHDSNLAGGVRVKYGSSAFARHQIIAFNQCGWSQRATPSEVVSYDEAAAGGNKTRPAVHFRDCRSLDYTNPFGASGASVWDATIGFDYGPPVKSAAKRSIAVRAIYGSLTDGDGPMKINLPVGAMITGLKAISPAANTPDPDGGTWALKTTEATPATIATLEVTGNMSAGFNIESELAVPYRCESRETATVTLASSGIQYGWPNTFLTIEGYW